MEVACLLFCILSSFQHFHPIHCQLDVQSHIVTSHSTKSGQKAVIFDDLFQESSLEAFSVLILDYSPWQLSYDQEISSSAKTTKKGDSESSDNECSKETYPWSVQIPSAIFTKTNIWRNLQQSLKFVTEKDDYQPSKITSQMLQRGVTMNTTCGFEEEGDFIIRMFLTPDWKKNDYGDLTLFNQEEDGDEIDTGSVFVNVKPKYGRAVMWDAGLPYLSHAPSMGYLQDLIFVTVFCTRDEERVKTNQKDVESKLIELDSNQFFRFPKLKKSPSSRLTNNEVKRFQDREERVVVVFDNLFGNEDVTNLKTYVTQQGPHFQYHQYDVNELMELTDNVKWTKQFEPEEFTFTQWWKAIAAVTMHISGDDTWYPYDISLRVAATTDQLQILEDAREWEDEYSFLMYLNSDEASTMLGETTFFDRPSDDDEIDEDIELYDTSPYDTIGAVQPKSGRAVVFHGAIPYSCRPPTPTYHGMSFIFAVKMSATKKFAIAKRLRKLIEDYPGELSEEDEDLLEELYDGSIKGEIHSSEEELKKQLHKYILKLEEFKGTQANKAKNILMRS